MNTILNFFPNDALMLLTSFGLIDKRSICKVTQKKKVWCCKTGKHENPHEQMFYIFKKHQKGY